MYAQLVLPEAHVNIVLRDCSSAAGDMTDTLLKIVESEIAGPLDTTQAPLLKAVLVRFAPHIHVLCIVLSHLVADGWSAFLIRRELTLLYSAYLTDASGQTCAHSNTSMHYFEFTEWQRRQLITHTMAREEGFWYSIWRDISDAHITFRELPFSRPRASVGSATRTSHILLTLDETITVTQLSKALHITPYVLFRTAITLALHWYTNKPRIALWTNCLNRHQASAASTIGWFSNSHLIPVAIDTEGTFTDQCLQVSRALREAQDHEALPLTALWQSLGRSLEMCSTRITFDLSPAQRAAATTELLAPMYVKGARQWMDLDIAVWREHQQFMVVVNHNSHRYESAGISCFLSDTYRIISRVLTDPHSTVTDCLRSCRYSSLELADTKSNTQLAESASGSRVLPDDLPPPVAA
jgi:hypothetical protein